MTTINLGKAQHLLNQETDLFAKTHPKSFAMSQRAKNSLLGGVPMHWMTRWPGGFPIFVSEAKDATFKDIDNNDYIDLCLGDTGAMTGHAPEAVKPAILENSSKGITTMLPSENALWVAEEMQRRFGLKYWQFALTATDANRFSLRFRQSHHPTS